MKHTIKIIDYAGSPATGVVITATSFKHQLRVDGVFVTHHVLTINEEGYAEFQTVGAAAIGFMSPAGFLGEYTFPADPPTIQLPE